MADLVQIDGSSNLVREIHSKAILNTDRSELSKYKKQKIFADKNVSLQQDVDYLKQEMSEIKSLLLQLIKG